MTWIVPFFIISAFLLAILTYINSTNQKTINTLSKRLERNNEKLSFIHENIKNLFDGYLYHLAYSRLSFQTNHESERITLYIHDKQNSFIPFSRISSNPTYKPFGRVKYPDNLGCIAQGWNSGWYFDNNFSDNWVDSNHSKYEIPKRVLNRMSMQSKLFAVLRIDNQAGKSLGLIVVESTDNNKYEEEVIKHSLEEQKLYLSDMVHKLRNYIPNTNEANAKGI